MRQGKDQYLGQYGNSVQRTHRISQRKLLERRESRSQIWHHPKRLFAFQATASIRLGSTAKHGPPSRLPGIYTKVKLSIFIASSLTRTYILDPLDVYTPTILGELSGTLYDAA